MHCPACQKSMKPLRIGDVRIDECPQCRGIWFDKGELKEAKDEISPDLRFLDFEIWNQKAIFNINDKPLDCPRCPNISMRAIT